MKDIVIYSGGLRRQDYHHIDDVNVEQSLVEKFRRWLPGDYEIYNMFRNRLVKEIETQGSDFQNEVLLYRNVLYSLRDFCQGICSRMKNMSGDYEVGSDVLRKTFSIAPHYWGPGFQVLFLVHEMHSK